MNEEDVTTKTISYDKFEAKMLQIITDGAYEPDRCSWACMHSCVMPVRMVCRGQVLDPERYKHLRGPVISDTYSQMLVRRKCSRLSDFSIQKEMVTLNMQSCETC